MYFIPEHVSPIAKDLIKRMLVIDPEKRITVKIQTRDSKYFIFLKIGIFTCIQMKEIMRHQWFTSTMPKNGDQVLPGALDDLSVSNLFGLTPTKKP